MAKGEGMEVRLTTMISYSGEPPAVEAVKMSKATLAMKFEPV